LWATGRVPLNREAAMPAGEGRGVVDIGVEVDFLDRLGLERPIAQAGLGGGLATGELAGAVAAAGGLGTIGIVPPARLGAEIRMAREIAPGRPVAVNLLLPFTRPGHVRACIDARVSAVVLFFGFDRRIVTALREAGVLVIHQVGQPDQARRAIDEGAQALIAQGLEAGGHLLAVRPLDEALPAILEVAAPTRVPVLAAGGIGSRERVAEVLNAGAVAAVAGTRFLLTRECHAHPSYQRRVLGAERTLETELFGFGWPARHRVVPNAATRRWCARAEAGSPLVRGFNRRTGRLGGLLPLSTLEVTARLQRPTIPLFSPGAALRGMPERTVDSTPLYAGVVSRDIEQIVPAGDAVGELTP
jgi:NAD(P)H-dependent flavin oxidoreductase YrpB (nitropropane dioxygenase family)